MKKIRIVLVALVMLISSVALCACGSDEMKIKALINEFEESCNQMDADGVLECLNPTIADLVNKGLGILDIFTEVDKDEVFDKVSDLLITGIEGVGGSDFFETMEIEIEEMEIERTSATVTGTITYEKNGEEKESPVTFICGYSDSEEGWYISEISFKK